MLSSPSVEIRAFGAQRFSLSRLRPGIVAYSLEHLDAAGRPRDWIGSFADPAAAWEVAARHAATKEMSGYCDGAILIRIARTDGRVHQGHLFSSFTACGLKFAGSALDYRVGGDGRDRSLITCRCCAPDGQPMRWRAPLAGR
jgi:hypothetical protein